MAEPAISKQLGLLVTILTLLGIVVGGVYWIVHQNDLLQTQVAVLQQQVQANSEGIKTLNSKRTDDEENFNRIMRIIAISHNAR